jgi:DNA polymerase I-like protein with 3'-5' exonuclease and polymerase domains
MKEIVFDIETNGFLEELTKVHCLVVSVDGGPAQAFNGGRIVDGLDMLGQAEVLIGHNIQDFDLPALRKVYPTFNPSGLIRDTLIMSRLIWPDITEQDYPLAKRNTGFPATMIGLHTLESWGYRLGLRKGDFKQKQEEGAESIWANWSQEMEDYCVRDVEVTVKLWAMMKSKNYSEDAIQLEHDFRAIISEQEREGFPFDMEKAEAFYVELLKKRLELDEQIAPYFPSWETHHTFTPKVNNKKLGYVKHVPFTKVKVHEFNPNSNKQVAERLKVQRGWKPVDFTPTGQPKIDGDILRALGKEWPECELLAQRADVDKIISMLAEGDSAWLKLARKGSDGTWRIHGKVITNGAVTGRCAHFAPNLGQIPKGDDGSDFKKEMGKRCRELFISLPGYSLVGWDASGLELRMLGSYMGAYDGGAYIQVVLEGDVHTVNQKAAGLPTRSQAKTFIYAFLYGAGGWKIGIIPGVTPEEIPDLKSKEREWSRAKYILEKRNMSTADENVALEVKGHRLKRQFIAGLPALGQLKAAVEEKATNQKFIKGLDGRLLPCRSPHSSLNTLLQSAGALVVKKATVLWHRKMEAAAVKQYCKQVVHVHDEAQSMVLIGKEEEIGRLAIESIKEAGAYFKLRCPLDGEFKVGKNWRETH